jgi:putative tricarboxylic transport membrane protein
VSEGRGRLARALPYVVVGIAAAYLYYAALNFSFHHRPGTLGPNAWPMGIALLMLLVCIFKAAEALLRKRVPLTPYEQISAAEPPDSAPPERHPWMLVLGMVATVLYVALVTPVGFFVCTVAYLAVFLWIGGYRRTGAVAAISVVGALVLTFVFMKLVYVSLPIGRPPFSAVMLGLMQLMGIR